MNEAISRWLVLLGRCLDQAVIAQSDSAGAGDYVHPGHRLCVGLLVRRARFLCIRSVKEDRKQTSNRAERPKPARRSDFFPENM